MQAAETLTQDPWYKTAGKTVASGVKTGSRKTVRFVKKNPKKILGMLVLIVAKRQYNIYFPIY